MAAYQVSSEMQTPSQLTQREPLLRAGLQGGLWVPGDGIVYAPEVARWFIADAGDNLTCLTEGAMEIAEPAVTLTCGKQLRAPAIVVACGLGANGLLGKTGCEQRKASWRSATATARYSIISWSNWATVPAPTAAAPRWRLTSSRAPPDSC